MSDESPKHPAGHRLDAVAAGDVDEGVAAHLTSCEACARHVADLREQVARFRATHDPGDLLARARASGERRPRARAGPAITRIGLVAAPLLAAALVLLVLRARPTDGGRGPSTTGTAAVTTATQPPTAPPGESRFKGGVVVAAVREREGRQERLVGPFEVRAGDRVRVEVSTDRDGPLAAGLLTDAGEWVTLLAPTAFEAGTHYSELAARFDESPTRATLLVGDPRAVEQARVTRDFGGVVAWRVTSEAAP
jgi:hypothetical protein